MNERSLYEQLCGEYLIDPLADTEPVAPETTDLGAMPPEDHHHHGAEEARQ